MNITNQVLNICEFKTVIHKKDQTLDVRRASVTICPRYLAFYVYFDHPASVLRHSKIVCVPLTEKL